MEQQAQGSYIGNGAPAQAIVTGLSGVLQNLTIWTADAIAWALDLAPPFGSGVTFAGADFAAGPEYNTAGVAYYWVGNAE